jgi:hypothetical protein
MIQYMPFTYISDDLGRRLAQAFGQLAVWQPLESLAPAHMLALAREGRLQWRRPEKIDPVQLNRAARSFNQWGELHGDKIGEMNTFFHGGQGADAQQDSVHQIRSQIRRWGAAAAAEADAALFQAALFLCLAHTYDHQQDALAQELGSVQRLESQFGQILGEIGDATTSIGAAVSPAGNGAADPGLFMTERRLRAWARLAASQADADGVFITTSHAVWEYLLTLFPEMKLMTASPSKGQPSVGRLSADELTTLLGQLRRAENPSALFAERCGAGCRLEGGLSLTLAALEFSPAVLFARIQKNGDDLAPPQAEDEGFHYTVLGYAYTEP